jgi:hypothetical protein
MPQCRGNALGLLDVFRPVDVEERIMRRSRELHCNQLVPRGPQIDLANVFFHQSVAKVRS